MSITKYSESAGPIGQSIYTFTGVVVPAQYMPRLVATTTVNKAGTNVEYKISVNYPLVSIVDGANVALNTIRANLNFTALQSVINTEEKLRVLDELVDYIVANKANIIEGNVLTVTNGG